MTSEKIDKLYNDKEVERRATKASRRACTNRMANKTRYLLQNPANAVRLLRSIEEADKGRLVEHELLDEPTDVV
jgi:hypothetical protein